MGRNEDTTSIKGQKDQATLSLIAFDKEKLLAMQQQVFERNDSTWEFSTVLAIGSNQHTKGISEETSGRSLEENEVQ